MADATAPKAIHAPPLDTMVKAMDADQCGNCRFRYAGDMPPPLLRCRRHPPVTVTVCRPNPESDPAKRPPHAQADWTVGEFSSFAIVAVAEWCGEHQRGEPHRTLLDLPPAPPDPVPPSALRPQRKRRGRLMAPI